MNKSSFDGLSKRILRAQGGIHALLENAKTFRGFVRRREGQTFADFCCCRMVLVFRLTEGECSFNCAAREAVKIYRGREDDELTEAQTYTRRCKLRRLFVFHIRILFPQNTDVFFTGVRLFFLKQNLPYLSSALRVDAFLPPIAKRGSWTQPNDSSKSNKKSN